MAADTREVVRHRFMPDPPQGGWRSAGSKPLAWAGNRLRRLYDYSMFVVVVAAVLLLAVVLETNDKVMALKIFVVAYFTLLPAILYLQFTSRKTLTVWREYVLSLFRLHADDYAHLPEPPHSSRYHQQWREARIKRVGEAEGESHERREEENIYRRRFEELYGPPSDRDASGAPVRKTRAVRLERAHKLQVLIATVLIALGWVFVVQPETVFARSITPADFQVRGLPAIPAESLSFAFLGAYFFVLQMLVRRFFQNDLKPTAYVNATVRIIIVVLLVWVLDPVLPESLGQAERSAIAFVIGVFPTIGWQALQSFVAVLLKRAVPALEAKDPLSELDGMNVWYEARLVEEGIEDVQNLATTDISNALLRTRIPPERLIDWVDQALLHLHAEEDDRKQLRRFGIRTATNLLDALAYKRTDSTGNSFASGIERLLNDGADGHPSVTRSIAVALQGERTLSHILAWRSFSPTPDLREQRLLKLALATSSPATNGNGAAVPAATTT